MIQAADTFVKNEHEPAPFDENGFYRHARARSEELHACNLEQKQEKFPSLALLLDIMTQQAETISGTIMFLFMGTKRPLD